MVAWDVGIILVGLVAASVWQMLGVNGERVVGRRLEVSRPNGRHLEV